MSNHAIAHTQNGVLEVRICHSQFTVWLVCHGPHDHRRSVLVSLHQLMHHLHVVPQSLLSKVLLTEICANPHIQV